MEELGIEAALRVHPHCEVHRGGLIPVKDVREIASGAHDPHCERNEEEQGEGDAFSSRRIRARISHRPPGGRGIDSDSVHGWTVTVSQLTVGLPPERLPGVAGGRSVRAPIGKSPKQAGSLPE